MVMQGVGLPFLSVLLPRCPVKYIGTGEKVDAFEPFSRRMSSRILGMGDMISFIEKSRQQWI